MNRYISTEAKVLCSLVIFFLVFLVSAGAQVTMSSDTQDQEAKAFNPPPEKAYLYLYRRTTLMGTLVIYPIFVDSQIIGYIAPGTFFLIIVDPGQHSILVGSTVQAILTKLSTEGGKSYYFEVSPASSEMSVNIKQVDESVGLKQIPKCKRAEAIAN